MRLHALTLIVLLAASVGGCGSVVDKTTANKTGGDENACPIQFGEPTSVAISGAEVRRIVISPAHVIWMTDSSVYRAPRSGGAVETVATGTDLDALVLAGSDLLWSGVGDDGTHMILRVDVEGGAPAAVISGLPAAVGAIAAADATVYWVDYAPQMSICCGEIVSVHRAPLAGGEAVTLGSADDGGHTRFMAAQSSGIFFTNGYATDPEGSYRIDHILGDGTPAKAIAASALPVRAAFVGDVVHWTSVDYGDLYERAAILRRTLPDGEPIVELATDEPEADRISTLVADARRIVWSGEDGLIRARCVGPERGKITSFETDGARAMAIDGDDLYLALESDNGDSIMRVPLY